MTRTIDKSEPSQPRGFRPGPFDYHQEIELSIETLTNQGQGLGRLDGWVVLVAFALPGERVRARVFRNQKQHSEADLIEVLVASPERIEPRCTLFSECSGCQYQNLRYPAQLEWKREQVSEVLQRLAGLETLVEPVRPSPEVYGYRSKITPHFQKPRDGKIGAIGFLRHGRRSELVDVAHCPIASPLINESLGPLREDVRRRALEYRKGATLLLRESAEGEICTDPTDVCVEKVGDRTFEFHAGEFFQNNPHILTDFARYVIDEARRYGASHLIDAYCGSGLFALCGADQFAAVHGIEISEAAVDWARRNARRNGLDHVQFIQGEADAIFAAVDVPAEDSAVIIDPPRRGSNPAFLEQLLAFAPGTVVYVSCNPATQMRDLTHLTEAYAVDRVQPFDLFPQTRHLECVVTLRKRPVSTPGN